MRVIYLIALPSLVILVGLFLLVSELSKALERSTAKITSYYDFQLDKDRELVFSILNYQLIQNQSIFDLSLVSAKVDVPLCSGIKEQLVYFAEIKNQKKYMEEALKYERAKCAQ